MKLTKLEKKALETMERFGFTWSGDSIFRTYQSGHRTVMSLAKKGLAIQTPAEVEFRLTRKGREISERCAKLEEALIWCSGSPSFAPSGEAREGFEKLVLPLLQPRRTS